jgi:hypothetical protein
MKCICHLSKRENTSKPYNRSDKTGEGGPYFSNTFEAITNLIQAKDYL